MGESQTVVRTEIVIDGDAVLLAPDQDVEDLKQRIESAAATTGTFVDFAGVGERSVSVLVTPHTHVAVVVSTFEVERSAGGELEPGTWFEFTTDLG